MSRLLARLKRGPRLGAKLLILMSFATVVIPGFSYLYLSEMEDFLVDSQAKAQLLSAEGISTLLNGRKDLFYELPLSLDGYEQLYAHSLANPIRIDGKGSDWEDVLQYSFGLGARAAAEGTQGSQGSQFSLALGEHRDQLYALVTIADDSLVFRDQNVLRLDASDHLRVTFAGKDGLLRRIVVTTTEPGVTTAYLVDEGWRYAVKGEAEDRIPGYMVTTEDGYTLEFRIPLALLGDSTRFGLAVVDVDDVETREVVAVTGTLPSAGGSAFGLVLLKSPEVLRIIRGLGYAGANIQVIDSRQRVRAEVGSYKAGSVTANDEVLGSALAGDPAWRRGSASAAGEVIIAAHPIVAQDEIIGAVVLRQDTNQILELRRGALQRIVYLSLTTILIFAALILLFSLRLAGRISKLGAEATGAIDIHGRLRTNQIRAETEAGDEIGDLARSISGMLARLHRHNQFLESMPRTLRHEINNPLNALSTSLENLEAEDTGEARDKYLGAAKRGVIRIGTIVQNLADAASLEEALQTEELEVVDLQELVESYLHNAKSTHQDREFRYLGTVTQVPAEVSDFRMEQLLDKLIDNAVDFSPPGSVIVVKLDKGHEHLTLSVANQGPTIADDMMENVFDSMVSIRESNPDNRLHFGMGLYVVRIIAAHHGGSVSVRNLADLSGVEVKVSLPLYLKPRELRPSEAAAI